MNPDLINLGFIEIRWYSILILLAFIIGYFLVKKEVQKNNLPMVQISDMCFYIVIFSILGARIYYCLFNLDYYLSNPISIFKIWEGGLAIHGGIIAGLILVYFYTKKKGLPFLKVVDIFIPSLVLGQAIGRWGNFFNSEAYGPITTLRFLENLKLPKFIIDGMYIEGSYHKPTFLYESLGCLVIFIIVLIIRKNKSLKSGTITSIYFILYGVIRFLIESLRQDSLMLLDIKVAQLLSILMILIGIALLIIINKRQKYDK